MNILKILNILDIYICFLKMSKRKHINDNDDTNSDSDINNPNQVYKRGPNKKPNATLEQQKLSRKNTISFKI